MGFPLECARVMDEDFLVFVLLYRSKKTWKEKERARIGGG